MIKNTAGIVEGVSNLIIIILKVKVLHRLLQQSENNHCSEKNRSKFNITPLQRGVKEKQWLINTCYPQILYHNTEKYLFRHSSNYTTELLESRKLECVLKNSQLFF